MLGLTASPASAASTGTITGSLSAAPKGGNVNVRAVNPASGQIGAVAAPTGRRYRLAVKPGLWFVVGSWSAGGGSHRTGSSHAVRVRAGKRRAAGVRLAGSGRGEVIGVGQIAIDGPGDLSGFRVDPTVTDDVFKSCGKDNRIVDESPDFEEAQREEIEFQRKHGDPATRVTPRPLKATRRVEGSGSWSEVTGLTIELRMVDTRTGRTVASESTTGAPGDLFDVIDGVSSRFARKACRKRPKAAFFSVSVEGFHTEEWEYPRQQRGTVDCKGAPWLYGGGNETVRYRTTQPAKYGWVPSIGIARVDGDIEIAATGEWSKASKLTYEYDGTGWCEPPPPKTYPENGGDCGARTDPDASITPTFSSDVLGMNISTAPDPVYRDCQGGGSEMRIVTAPLDLDGLLATEEGESFVLGAEKTESGSEPYEGNNAGHNNAVNWTITARWTATFKRLKTPRNLR